MLASTYNAVTMNVPSPGSAGCCGAAFHFTRDEGDAVPAIAAEERTHPWPAERAGARSAHQGVRTPWSSSEAACQPTLKVGREHIRAKPTDRPTTISGAPYAFASVKTVVIFELLAMRVEPC